MNRPLLLIPLLLLFFVGDGYSQNSKLFIKKGVKKKQVYEEGDRIHLLLKSGVQTSGLITHLIDSTIYINGKPIYINQVDRVLIDGIVKNKLPDAKLMALIAGGVALTTVGLTLNGANDFPTALKAGLTIGYAPIAIRFIGGRFLYALKKKKYIMGKKYRLQLLDLNIPRKRQF